MKKNFWLLGLIFLAMPLFAKENDEVQTLFGGKEFKSGGYGAPELKILKIKDDVGLAVGGRGGWIVNSTFSIGLGGYGLVTNHEVKDIIKDTALYLRVGWGGLFLNYTYESNKVLHFTANALIGGGGAVYTKSMNELMIADHDEKTNYGSSGFFVFEPGLGVELNVTTFFRIELGASYRFVSGLEMPGNKISSNDLSGLSGNLAFKFGKF